MKFQNVILYYTSGKRLALCLLGNTFVPYDISPQYIKQKVTYRVHIHYTFLMKLESMYRNWNKGAGALGIVVTKRTLVYSIHYTYKHCAQRLKIDLPLIDSELFALCVNKYA